MLSSQIMAADDLSPINVRFTEAQLAALRTRSKQDLVPVQRHIRRAVDLYLLVLADPNGFAIVGKLLGEGMRDRASEEHKQSNQQVVFT